MNGPLVVLLAFLAGSGLVRAADAPVRPGPAVTAYPDAAVSPPQFWTFRRAVTALGGIVALVLGGGTWLLGQRRQLLSTRASEVRFRSLIEHSFDATFVLNANGTVKFMTPAARRLLGEADRARLFTAFQRGGNVRHLPGTGLGLVVIRHCLDLHQGELELTSTEGLGTTGTVRVPLFIPPSA